jgi:hypothetical protein
LSPAVTQLWGGRHVQAAPSAWYEKTRVVRKEITEQEADGTTITRQVSSEVVDRVPVPLASSRIEVDLDLEHRRKGLLWYDTYAVAFDGRYRLKLPDGASGPLHLRFAFPSPEAIYDDFVFRVDGEEIPPQDDLTAGIAAEVELTESRESLVEVGYRSRGLDDWQYLFVPAGVAQVRDFLLSPTSRRSTFQLAPCHRRPRVGRPGVGSWYGVSTTWSPVRTSVWIFPTVSIRARWRRGSPSLPPSLCCSS